MKNIPKRRRLWLALGIIALALALLGIEIYVNIALSAPVI